MEHNMTANFAFVLAEHKFKTTMSDSNLTYALQKILDAFALNKL
jgi:hypothetical protein